MKALIDGITGQDGSYLAEFLLEKGYEVHGIIRRSSSFNTDRVDHIFKDIKLYYGDLSDGLNIYSLINSIKPDEYYHLGAQSHVRVSFDIPVYTADVSGTGTMRVLEAIRQVNKDIKFYNAGSSEMFGKVKETPQNEDTPFHPRSPYACAKCYSYWITRNYREGYGMFTCNGILFNHESPRRGGTFVTKKITDYVKGLWKGEEKGKLYLGNLEAKRDWGYAKDYVEAMWLMLQQKTPDDYVIATGETHTVKEFLEEAFSFIGKDWKEYVEFDEKYYRPAEVDILLGDATKARKQLGWEPKVRFKELVEIMLTRES